MAKETKTLDTVRSRKKNAGSASQRFLPVAEIHNDTILLKNGGIRAILAVEAINFNLKSETEQQGIIAGYGSFVNTLTFPLQIVIRSTKTNIDEYLEKVRGVAETHENELLKNLTLGYTNFMQKLVDVADIMQKRFYVVVPYDMAARKKSLTEQFFDWLHPDDSSSKAGSRGRLFISESKKLAERVDLVSSGLSNIGLHPVRLNTRELIELMYQIYNPKTSQNQKLPKNLEQLKLEGNVL